LRRSRRCAAESERTTSLARMSDAEWLIWGRKPGAWEREIFADAVVLSEIQSTLWVRRRGARPAAQDPGRKNWSFRLTLLVRESCL